MGSCCDDCQRSFDRCRCSEATLNDVRDLLAAILALLEARLRETAPRWEDREPGKCYDCDDGRALDGLCLDCGREN